MKPQNRRPIAIDLFSGVGGMSLGFEQAGFDVVAAFDVEDRHVATYQKNFPETRACVADLADVGWRGLREAASIDQSVIDVLFGGSPCQGFSICGRRDSGDERNLLLFEFVRLVREIQPRYFVLENVDGLLGPHAEPIRQSFERRVRYAGYRLVRPVRALDAADFGVPQRRRRVFYLGYQDGAAPPQYPKPRQLRDQAGKRHAPTVGDAIGDLPEIECHEYLFDSDRFEGPLGAPSRYASLLRGDIRESSDRSRKRPKPDVLTGCARTKHTDEVVERFSATRPGTSEPISRYHRLDLRSIAPALRAGTNVDRGKHTAARPIHPIKPRCITTREAARLHSFPDWFEFHDTRWHAFRQIGNSVPPRLARFVAASVNSIL